MQKIHTADKLTDVMTKSINLDKFIWYILILVLPIQNEEPGVGKIDILKAHKNSFMCQSRVGF